MSITRPAIRDLRIARNVAFGVIWTFTRHGVPIDFAGWTGTMQWRLYEGQPGAAKLMLGSVGADIQGIRNLGLGRWQVLIDQATLAALPAGVLSGTPLQADDIRFVHELTLAPPGGRFDVWCRGLIALHSGVTFNG